METNFSKEKKYLRAKKRVDELKGFYWHFASYFIVNMFISISKIFSNISNGETFIEAFWDFGTFAVWIFWGIGLAIHGLNIMEFSFLFGKDWEERQIKKIMEEEKNQYKSL